MARRDFVSISSASSFVQDEGIARYFETLRENLELVTGQRGDSNNFAVLRGDVNVVPVTGLLSASDPTLANAIADIYTLQATLNALISALRNPE